MTANEIIGSLVYRTNNALNRNSRFLTELKGYRYYPAIVSDDKLHLWHFCGTGLEISQAFQVLPNDSAIGSLKFPAVMNFQGVLQGHYSGYTVCRYNLAIVAPVFQDWTTQEREEQVYKKVLKPIEDEFIRQISRFPHFQNPVGNFPYNSTYIPTTGNALNSVMKVRYGDYIDVIELPNLSIKVLSACDGMSDLIVSESKKVTEEIKEKVR
ncbi:MAG: hypothetical protein LBG96_16740 [Tannerella sp.]|jgi:hypothetical protein|nr:hypothetical protein [Tannerella sp.]